MLLRSNPCYPVAFTVDRRGLLIVARRFILATGIFARCYR